MIEQITQYAGELATYFKYPGVLWLIPVAVILIFILLKMRFINVRFDPEMKRKRHRMRIIVMFLRSAAVILLLIALATPFTTITQETDGDPRALLLIDNSASMDLFDTSFTEYLTNELSARLPTTVKTFGSAEESPVGDAALGHPEHLLLISDGNANTGVSMRDVAQAVRQQNLSISMIELSPTKYDAAVRIDAPLTVPLGFPTQIGVEVSATNEDPVPLTVRIDGREVYNQLTTGAIELNPELSTGYHKIEARINSDDDRADNNVHYRVIEVLEKPRVLVVSEGRGAVENTIASLFDVTVQSSLPGNLDTYGAVVINDRKASAVGSAERLADYLRDESGDRYGNGLVVIGGFNSYDRGGYQRTELETLLPVKVGKPKREMGENNLVFVIQVSGSTGGVKYVQGAGGGLEEIQEDIPVVDIIKAQAVNAIESLNLQNNVGVIMFGADTAGQDFGSADEARAQSVVKIADVRPLYSHKKQLVDDVSRIQGGGTTAPDLALRAAVDMLKTKSGGKTIIFLTNGRFSAGLGDLDAGAKSDVENIIGNAARRYGIKTHVIGVGSTDFGSEFEKKVDETFLFNMAQRADGLYDRATNMARLMLEYGDPDEKGFGDQFTLVTLSLTHFITRDVVLEATLNGFNEVAPKDGSRILVKTDGGSPALTIWNYFNGRVAALTVFTGSGIGPLLSPPDSDLLRNTIQWAVGDPRRLQDVSASVDPAIVGRETEVTFTSKNPISGNCDDTQVQFSRSSGDTYVFTFTPESPGFHTVCSVPYAVNSVSEHWSVGVSEDLREAVQITDGGIFNYDEIDAIVEKIQNVSTRVTVEKTELRSPFVGLAILIFLLEIFIRRLTRHNG